MKVFPHRSSGFQLFRGTSQTRDNVGGEAGEETPSGAGRGGVASTETGAEAEVFSLTMVGGSAGGGGGEGEGGGGGGG